MKPDQPSSPQDEREIRITALLLGELTPDEAEATRQAISQDPDLAQLEERLKETIRWVRATANDSDQTASFASPELRLSPPRRELLLRYFRQPEPELNPAETRQREWPWYVPASLAAALVCLLGFAAVFLNVGSNHLIGPLTKIQESIPQQYGGAGRFETVEKLTELGQAAAPQQQDTAARFESLSRTETPAPGIVPPARQPAGERWFFSSTETTDRGAISSPDGNASTTIANRIGGFGGGAFAAGEDSNAKAKIIETVRQDLQSRAQRPLSRGNTVDAAGKPPEEIPAVRQLAEARLESVVLGAPFITATNQISTPVVQFGVAATPTPAAAAPIALHDETTLGRNQATAFTRRAGRASLEPATTDAQDEPAGDGKQLGDTLAVAEAETIEPAVKKGIAQVAGISKLSLFHDQTAEAEGREEGVQLADKKEAFAEQLGVTSAGILAANALGYGVIEQKDSPGATDLDADRAYGGFRAKRFQAPKPAPEVQAVDQPYSTFSLNVSDVSFRLSAASLENGILPDPAIIRSEEFINAFDYRDPEPPPGAPVSLAWEMARYPFAQNREVLRMSLKTAATGRSASQPINLVLLLDNSGSMERADRVRIIQECLKVLASQLRPEDKISVVAFARTARLWADGLSGDQAQEALQRASELTPQGGTNLEDALDQAYATAARHFLAHGVNRVVLLTDGAANLGDVAPASLKQKVEHYRQRGIALDCFGIGWEGYHDELLEMLSRNGDGRYGFVNTPDDAAEGFANRISGALKTAAADVKVQVQFNPQRVTLYRQIGYAKHQLTQEQFRDATVDAAEIAASESGTALYVVGLKPQGEGPLGWIRVRYKLPSTGEFQEHEWMLSDMALSKSFEQASPALRLATVAAAFSEWLASSPFAADLNPDQLLRHLQEILEIYPLDNRPRKLETMIQQAKSAQRNP
jgi:Mg-chelatase subunit ChlD